MSEKRKVSNPSTIRSIQKSGQSDLPAVVNFAQQQLETYLRRMQPGPLELALQAKTVGHGSWALYLGASTGDVPVIALPRVDNQALDDAIEIKVTNGQGFIAGNNPRSLLLAVYRFLREAGCTWVRPGDLGERIPRQVIESITVNVMERAAYRHRGICIEGAVSRDHLLDIIDWAPKAGFNSYFIQFREAFTFFERWYQHWENPLLSPEPFDRIDAQAIVHEAEEEIQKRGLLYHAVGHGWTCEPLGIPGLGWTPNTYTLDDHTRSLLAEVNGKREIWQGIPLNTNLCYSNPDVQTLLVKSILEYLRAHPGVDYLHFWLADDRNNQCECESCRRSTPSDLYVDILNTLDQTLTAAGIAAKIVFLIYFDLLWPPVSSRIANPDRFILMFAPITRTYSQSYQPSSQANVPEYRRNQLKFPASIQENLAFLNAWREIFSGDSFDFDYHLWRDHYNDPGYSQINTILHQDITQLKALGLNGLMSCQAQRAFFPTGLPMAVMGRTLWDDRLPIEQIVAEYYFQAFGSEGDQAKSYLERISDLFDPPYLRGEKARVDPAMVEKFTKIPAEVAAFRPVIELNLATLMDPVWLLSWHYLKAQAEMADQLSQLLILLARGESDSAKEQWKNLQLWAASQEERLQTGFDLFEWSTVLNMSLFQMS